MSVSNGLNINTIGDDTVDNVVDYDDDDAVATFTDDSGPRLSVGNTTIAVWQPFDGLPELIISSTSGAWSSSVVLRPFSAWPSQN